MTARSRVPGAGFEPIMMGGGTGLYSTESGLFDQRMQGNSFPDEMMTIDENREEDFADTRPFAKSRVSIAEAPVPPVARSPSMFRRLTTRLRTSGSNYRPGSSQRKSYANVDESEADHVPVDLSSLEGLGFELREMANINSERQAVVAEQDTAYRGATDEPQSPSTRGLSKPRTIGDGLVIGAQLKRDPSRVVQISRDNTQRSIDNLQRMKTVRQVAKDLAEDRGQIIAFDLSSYEGAGLTHRQSTTFDDMSLGRMPTSQDTQSYFFPPDPEIPNWKPYCMRPPYILMLVSIALGLAGLQEYLCQTSMRKQSQRPPSGLLAFNTVQDVSTWSFFVWKYLPTMITIFYSVLFSIMDFDIRRLEPYYQLSQPQGARASASLNLDHMTMFQYFVPFNAARLGQWTVCVSTFANIIAATVAPALQNPAINFEDNNDPSCAENGCADNAKRFWVLIDPIWSRLLSASYLFVGFSALFLFFQLRRKSGLLSDPRGIAGIAAMATKSHILQDFKGLDLATRGDIHRRLAHRTYVLYKSSIWQGEWTASTEKPISKSNKLRSPHPVMLQLKTGILFITCMFLCLVAVPIISLTPARAVPNQVPWLPILVATILKLVWSTFEADVRLMEPFYQLSKGNCTPQNSLTLDYQSAIYGLMPFRAAFNGHFLVALVGLSSVCLDIFSVTIGSFSVDSAVFLKDKGHRTEASQDETFISFVVSLTLSVSILVFVILVAILVYCRRRHPFLPREPSTIAAVLSFIYSSKMLTDFIDTERLDNKSMEMKLKELDKRYALAWFRGRDDEVHCAIDEEPMVSRYVHGKPYRDAVTGPLGHDPFYYP